MQLAQRYLLRAVCDPSDLQAREQLMFAAMLAGTAMGNAGTHLPRACDLQLIE
jgi:alcohol dehydrogenase class IV